MISDVHIDPPVLLRWAPKRQAHRQSRIFVPSRWYWWSTGS